MRDVEGVVSGMDFAESPIDAEDDDAAELDGPEWGGRDGPAEDDARRGLGGFGGVVRAEVEAEVVELAVEDR